MKLPRYKPMLATKRRLPFDAPGWAFELKLDGIRGIWSFDGSSVALRTRSGRLVNDSYPELLNFRPPVPCVLDGEVIAFGEDGNPSFDLLQHRMSPGDTTTPVAFVVFDVLFWESDVTSLPLSERRQILEAIDLPSPFLLADQLENDGIALFEAVVAHDLEGIVAKRLDSPYSPGRRSDNWIKIMHRKSMRAVVGGFLPGTGWRETTFGSLAVGLWDGELLRYVGNVGSGFTDRDVRAIAAALAEMRQPESPFLPDATMPAETVFVVPSLVAHIEYANWTDDAHLRAPVFKGFGSEPHREVTWVAEGPGA